VIEGFLLETALNFRTRFAPRVNYPATRADVDDPCLTEVEHAWVWNIEIDSQGKGQQKLESRIAETAT
jgi:hypothetical protein